MNKILLTAAALLVSTGFALADDIGIGAHVGPGGVGAHVGPLHGGVGVVPEREHRDWHRGVHFRALPDGIVIGDPCWRKELSVAGWEWVYVCD